jgi:hypothetical protein
VTTEQAYAAIESQLEVVNARIAIRKRNERTAWRDKSDAVEMATERLYGQRSSFERLLSGRVTSKACLISSVIELLGVVRMLKMRRFRLVEREGGVVCADTIYVTYLGKVQALEWVCSILGSA